jgi:hypothetical protein
MAKPQQLRLVQAACVLVVGACITLAYWHGRLEIDHNAAERALRAVARGRKNYLFAGSDSGGERAATIYSLIMASIRKLISVRC